MTKHDVVFTRDTSVDLTHAILLYSGGQTASYARETAGKAFASYHPVTIDAHGRPEIGAGVPLERKQLRDWTRMLGEYAPPQLLPDHVLVSHPEMLAWWIPARRRTAYFKISRPTPDLAVLGQEIAIEVPYPAHVLIARNNTLEAYALERSERPGGETPLLHSPILNVFVDGTLCWGNIAKPRRLDVAAIPAFEAALFDSWSTHPNIGQDATITDKRGLVRLWDDLAAKGRRSFPVAKLKPFGSINRGRRHRDKPVTLRSIIENNS